MARCFRKQDRHSSNPFAATILELCSAACWLCTSLWLAQQLTHLVLLHASPQWPAPFGWLAPLQALLRLTL